MNLEAAGSSGIFITPHAQRERGKVISVGVHNYMFVDQKNLNHTLAMD